jgi:Mg2+ and Co2+ transporter CorA
MKNEMIKFVSENFEIIKNNFYQAEKDIIEELDESNDEIQEMIDYLEEQMNEVSDADSLLELINERSIGIDFDDKDDCNELLEQIELYLD